MARTARVKKDAMGMAHYHLMSRANDSKFLFEKGRVKDSLIDALKRAAEFSGIGLEAYAGMDNHFHVVCKVVRTDEPVPEDELVRRVGVLKGQKAAEKLAKRWEELSETGCEALVKAEQSRLRLRMNDISEFMKTLKEVFNICFKRERGYTGSIWSGRFKSTLIEGGKYLETCRRYVYLNPVRAGLVKRAADYAWCWIVPSDERFAGPLGARPPLWHPPPAHPSGCPLPTQVGVPLPTQVGVPCPRKWVSPCPPEWVSPCPPRRVSPAHPIGCSRHTFAERGS